MRGAPLLSDLGSRDSCLVQHRAGPVGCQARLVDSALTLMYILAAATAMNNSDDRDSEQVTTWISALKRFTQIYCANNLRSDKVGAGQLTFLVSLYKKDGISQEYLAKRLFFDKATVARAIEALEKEGLVTRTECAEDKRKKIVNLTDKARDMQKTYTELLKNWNQVLLEGVTESDKRVLIKLLVTMHDNATRHIESQMGESVL